MIVAAPVVFVLLGVKPPRTICDIFVATDAGMVVIDALPSDVCVARDVMVSGTTVDVCCVFGEPII